MLPGPCAAAREECGLPVEVALGTGRPGSSVGGRWQLGLSEGQEPKICLLKAGGLETAAVWGQELSGPDEAKAAGSGAHVFL
jgi:hypothetical protein